MKNLYGIGDRVTFVQVVEDERVIQITGTVVGLATAPGSYLVKIDGTDDWRAGDAVALAHTAGGRLP